MRDSKVEAILEMLTSAIDVHEIADFGFVKELVAC